MVYKGMILPILEYGDIFLASASVENRKRFQILQNKGLRCALNKGLETSSEELHLEANLLKLKYRQELHMLNYIYGYAQINSNRKVPPKTTIRTRSQKKLLLKIKRPYTEKYKKSLSYRGPKKWNSLSAGLQFSCSKIEYKAKVSALMRTKVGTNNANNSVLNINSGIGSVTITEGIDWREYLKGII